MGNTFSIRRNTITYEEENFTRFGKAVVGIGTNILKELLETYIPSNDIAIKVTSASHPYLWGRLNPQQRLLIGQAATDGYKDFDITLCYTLLRNLNVRVHAPFCPPFPKPTRGWGNQPLATDTTQSDDIERIRILRNEMYGHLARPYIPIVQFTVIWNQLRDVCTRMKVNYPNGTDFLKELRILESCKLTRVQWNSIVELVQQIRDNEKAMEDHSNRLICLEDQQNTFDKNLQSASAHITSVNNKVQNHAAQISTLDTEVQRHDAKIDEHARQLGTMDTEVQRHDAKIDEHARQLGTMDTEVQSHDAKIDEHARQLGTMDTEVQRHDAKIDEHARQLGTMDTEVQRHDAKIDEHARQLGSMDTEVQRHDAKIDEHARQLGTMDTEVQRHDAKIDNHARQLGTMDTEVQRHDAKIDEHARQLGSMDTEVQRHDAKIDEHARQLGSMDTEVQRHDAKIDEHARQLGSMDTEVQRHDAKIDNHARQLGTMDTEVQRHGIQLGEHGVKLDEYRTLIRDNTRHLGTLETEAERHTSRIEEHGRQIDEYGRQIDGHGRQLGILDSRYNNQQAQLFYIKKQLTTSERESGELKLDNLRETLLKINKASTRGIQLSPLQDRGEDEIPIELLFASVVIREDYRYADKQRKSCKASDVTDPMDIFFMNAEFAQKVYMLGDAAHGKTTYCLWLLKKWCNAVESKASSSEHLDKWEKCMKKFNFVFLVQFRNVSKNLASVVDMICEDVFMSDEDWHSTIRHVLASDKYRSLIIMDGLDEWNPHEVVRTQLTCQGMPNIHVSSTVSCFISMRPWVFALISKMVKINHRVIEIHGLSEEGITKVVENVLLNHFEMKEDIHQFELTREKIVKHLSEESLKSFMQIPLLAVVCVQIWHEGKQVGDSMTSFYAEMINMLIERAGEKHKVQTEHGDNTNMVDYKLPEILTEYETIKNCVSVLMKLGKVAYVGLLSNKTNLVFQKSKLDKELGERELQSLLNVGLISRKEARSLTTKNVSVHFFHKSIQEFLAAIYIVTNKEVGDSFCKHLSNTKVIMELSNVIMFICGMCPSLGSVISQRVVSVADSDTEISEYRESPTENKATAYTLYTQQVKRYRELRYGHTDIPVIFHVSDVFLSKWDNDIETERLTRKLLSDHDVEIRSLYLDRVSTNGKRGITNKDLNDFLSDKFIRRSMVTLSIFGEGTDRSIHTICIPTLRTLYLDNVKISNIYRDDNVCPSLLSNLATLRLLILCYMTLGDRGLDLPADMEHVEKVMLWQVSMSAEQWQQFILSLLNIQHTFDVFLHETNIDDESKTKVRESPDFNITLDNMLDKYGGYVLHFTRLWPLLNSK